jgi:hypothetical protein
MAACLGNHKIQQSVAQRTPHRHPFVWPLLIYAAVSTLAKRRHQVSYILRGGTHERYLQQHGSKPGATTDPGLRHNIQTACRKCRDPGANRGPSDLRPDAFPTELSRLMPLDGRMGPMSDRGASMLHKGLQIEGEGFGELRFVM